MIAASNISNSTIAILEAAAGLRSTLVVIERFANAAQVFATTTGVGGVNPSVRNLWLARRQVQSAVHTPTIPSNLAKAAAPLPKAKQKRSAEPSSATTDDGTRASRNRLGIGALSVMAPWNLATAFSLFHKMLKLDRKPNANDTRPGKGDTEHPLATPTLSAAYARFLRSLAALEGASIAAATPTLIRALDGIASGLDRLMRAARSHSMISAAIVAIPATALALIGFGGAHWFVLRTLRPFLFRGLREVLWLLRNVGVTRALRSLGRLVTKAVEIGSLLTDLSLGRDLAIAAVVGLAVAGRELYRHWNATKSLLSRSVGPAHMAGARPLKSMMDAIRNAVAYAGKSITTFAAATSDALHLPTAARTASARGVNRARAITRPVPMLRAVGRAAAAAAFAAPLTLAGAPGFAAPIASNNDSARIAAPLSAVRMAQTPVVINYAPNVVIHSEDAADAAALKHRVMEVLERQGRELHQTLQREMIRQQRRDF